MATGSRWNWKCVWSRKIGKNQVELWQLKNSKTDTTTMLTRAFTWDLFEKPWSSVWAKHYALFSLAVVVISTVTFILSTMEEVGLPLWIILKIFKWLHLFQIEDNGPYNLKMQIIDSIDVATVAFFTFEYFIRISVCPNKVINLNWLLSKTS